MAASPPDGTALAAPATPVSAAAQLERPGEVTWQPVQGPLGGDVPGLQVDVGTPLAWHGGFSILESATYWQVDRGIPRVTWPGPAVWLSRDGIAWVRRTVPGRDPHNMTVLPWRDGLAVVETQSLRGRRSDKPGHRSWRFRAWSSADGERWRRLGSLTLRPTGSLVGCGLYHPQVVSAGDRLVVVASCYVELGSGGDVAPRLRTVGAAQTSATVPAAVPTYAWSSADGRRWSRHLVARTGGHLGDDARFTNFWSAAGGALAALWDPRRVLWTRDGRKWIDIGPLPSDGDIRNVGAYPVVDEHGDPRTWIATAQLGAADPDRSGLRPEPPHLTIWIRKGDGPWQEVAGQEGWGGVSVSVDGETVVIVIQEGWDLVASERFWMLVSRDGAATWSHSVQRIPLPSCGAGVELHGTDVLLQCVGEDAVLDLRRAHIGDEPAR